MLTATFAWLRWTTIGLQFRAMASNPSLLATLGRDIRGLRWAVFGFSGALATIVAIATARDVGFDPNVGMRTVSGWRSGDNRRWSWLLRRAPRPLASFLVCSVPRSFGHTSARWEDATTFLLLAAFLLLVPGGLRSLVMGRAIRLEDAR